MIRAKHNRRVNQELKFVNEAIEGIPAVGQLEIVVPRQDEKQSRTASLAIRYASFDFPPPINRATCFQQETDEWQCLYCHVHGFPLVEEPPSIQQAVIWIAQLGEFLARRHDGFPGVKTLWRGLQRLHDMASTWKLLHSPQNQNL